MKRSVFLLLLIVLLLAGSSMPAYADGQDYIALGEACLSLTPPDYEAAAQYFSRAGKSGAAEGYYLLAGMYEKGQLIAGDPCTDGLEALGAAEAHKYYALAARGGYAPAQEKLADSYQRIKQDEARRVMEEDTACILLDVRTREEYDGGHIPGAICIPVESITAPPEMLPDFNRTILVYCRSGRRSKQAAQKLAAMGYADVREFGGILDWGGGIITSEEDSDFLALTGLSRMAAALNAGAAVEKVFYTDGYGFSDSSFTTAEPGEIGALWDALRGIQLGGPNGTFITDWYPQIIFYLDNGQRFGVRFDGPCLDNGRNYELENAEAFWGLTRGLTAKYGD